MKTDTILDKILANTAKEVAQRQADRALHIVREQAEKQPAPLDFVAALQRDRVALIAEVKHASPSRGVLIDPFNPLELADLYHANGAAAISVLTDQQFFRGSLDILHAIHSKVASPLLCKDFILTPYQIYEARAAGADALLLIVAALPQATLETLHALARCLGMAALVEVHNEAERDRALALSPALLGINNRDLKTFDVDLDTVGRLANSIPEVVTLVAESGLKTPQDVKRMAQQGADAVLIGEGLVTAGAPARIAEQVRVFSAVKV
ncbi:MAG: indole-3-glycerol phosphate synthase TrpC [Chloroflexi bacterium]|nr:indole-3-glycerol phosphate synthase TrpC [Chloroflexota bacterium]